MRKKNIIFAILIGVFALGLIGCGKKDSSTETTVSSTEQATNTANDKKDLKPVRLGIPGTEDTSVLLELASVAYDKGYFEEELNEKG